MLTKGEVEKLKKRLDIRRANDEKSLELIEGLYVEKEEDEKEKWCLQKKVRSLSEELERVSQESRAIMKKYEEIMNLVKLMKHLC